MPSILVVEHEGRYIERIQEALSSEGWRPRFVAGRPEALRAAASQAPNLVLVNAELPGAPELLRGFARRHGGPGSVALIGERSEAEGLEADADELLAKPFSDQELRLVVRRRLAAAEQPAPPPPQPAAGGDDDDHKLTSQEIFGDLLAEVEGEVESAPAAGAAATSGAAVSGAASTAPAPVPPAPAAGRGEEALAPSGGGGEGARPSESRSPAGAGGTGRSRHWDDDVELRLERTLSGVPGLASRRPATPAAAASPATPAQPEAPASPGAAAVLSGAAGAAAAGTAGAEAPRAAQAPGLPPHREPPGGPPPGGPPEPPQDEPPREEPPPPAPLPDEPPHRDPQPDRPPQGDPPPERRTPRSLRPESDDVDELLNMTLTGLDLGPRAGRRAAPAAAAETTVPRPAPRSSEIDLSEIEALAGVGRRRAPRPSGGPAIAPPPLTAEPPSAPPESGVPDEAGEALPAADPGAPMASAEVPAESAADDEPAVDAAPGNAAAAPGGAVIGDTGFADAAVDAAYAASGAEPDRAAPTAAARDDGGGPAPADPDAVPAEAAPSEAVPAAPTFPSPNGGRRFGHYTLLDRIAVGGMAEVWKARMSGVEGFQKTVAIKRILPHMNDDSDFVDMFIDEAKLAAQLNHPNITHIYDLGKIGDDFYIAMEYVDGRNLRAILNESRRKRLPLPVGFGLVVASRLASALDHAHRKRDFDDRELELVHRDVSPQNVLISTDGDIKLCDFGISKAVAKVSQTETGALKGKLQYMSPEQAWGRAVDGRSDIFSLGALTFEMLTGERLFTGDSEISVLEAVRECRARGPRQVNPDVPAAADAVVRKALGREPEDRFQTAGEMQQAIEEILYQLRPTPGQSDVAAFLARLEQAPDVKPGSRGEPAHTGSHTGSHTGGREAAGSAAGRDQPDTGTGTGGEAGGGTAGKSAVGIAAAAEGSWAAGERAAEERSGATGGPQPPHDPARPDQTASGSAIGRATTAPADHDDRWRGGAGGDDDTAGGWSRPDTAPGGEAADATGTGAAAARSAQAGGAAAAQAARWWWPFGTGRKGPSAQPQRDDHGSGAAEPAAPAAASLSGAEGGTAGGGGVDADDHAGSEVAGSEWAAGERVGSESAGRESAGRDTASSERTGDERAGAAPAGGNGADSGTNGARFAPAAGAAGWPPRGDAFTPVSPPPGERTASPADDSPPAAAGPAAASQARPASPRPGAGAPAVGHPGPAVAATPAADATHGGSSAPRGEALAAGGEARREDDAARGRWLLIAAILLLAVVSLAAWLWLVPARTSSGIAAPADEPPPAAATPEPGTAEEPPASADAPAAVPDLERLVDEQLAETQETLRAQAEAEYQERARRIREQIEALERANEQPATPPPSPASDAAPGSEDASAVPPPGGDAGASAAAGEDARPGGTALLSPSPAAPADRLVSFAEAQYPAAARRPRNEAPTPAGTSRRG